MVSIGEESKLFDNLLAGSLAVRSLMDMRLDCTSIDRDDFMKFFRDDEMLAELTADDRIEIFSHALIGSSDITKDLLDSLIHYYSVDNLEVIEMDPNRESKFDSLPYVVLESASLLSRWGFDDGDCLAWLKDYGEVDEFKVLEAIVRAYLLPLLDVNIQLCCLHTIHNPVRVLKVNGVDAEQFWDDDRSFLFFPDIKVTVAGEHVLAIARIVQNSKFLLFED
jgi:hypothetical protein